RYPDVRLDFFCTARTVDLVEERFDLGIRAGVLADSTLVARSLGHAKWFLAATPAYLKKRGRPRSPEDLKNHDALLFCTGIDAASVRLESGDQAAHLALSARLMVGDMDVLVAVALAGQGIAVLPAFRCVDELRTGRLERVLTDWNVPSTPVHVVYPSTRHL